MNKENIETYIKETIQIKRQVFDDLVDEINKAINLFINSLENKNKILICGNGGSAADSQHFAAELVIRFERDRNAFPAIALSTDTSILTAGSNDRGFEHIFSRQVQALGKEGDILVAITTSGNSQNIVNAIKEAKNKKLKVVLFNGKGGGKLRDESVDAHLLIPCYKTSYIQESHEMIYHIICEIVEKHFCEK